MIINNIDNYKKTTYFSFSSIQELKLKIESFKLIYGDGSKFQLTGHGQPENLRYWVAFSRKKNDGYYADIHSSNICDESPFEIGNKYINQKDMGYKIEINGRCYGYLQPEHDFGNPEQISDDIR